MKKEDILHKLEILWEYVRSFEKDVGWLNEAIERMDRNSIPSDLIISFLDLNKELEIRINLDVVRCKSPLKVWKEQVYWKPTDQKVEPLPILFHSARVYEISEAKVFTTPNHPIRPLLQEIDKKYRKGEYEELNNVPYLNLYFLIKRMNENPEEVELEKLSHIKNILLMEIALEASKKGIKKLRNDKEAVMLLSEAIPYMDEEFIKIQGKLTELEIKEYYKEIQKLPSLYLPDGMNMKKRWRELAEIVYNSAELYTQSVLEMYRKYKKDLKSGNHDNLKYKK